MLIREDERGVLAIGQPSHAWISGQLARAWGGLRFGRFEPYDEVTLAAEQHDVGWAARDLEPLYNPHTGLPRSFMEMPLDVHLGLFTEGPRNLVAQSRYAALLVSLHGRRLYERRDLDALAPQEAQTVRSFIAEQRAFQQELLAALRADSAAAASADDGQVERNSLLVWTWDYISLALCLDWARATAKGVPTADGVTDIEVRRGAQPRCVELEPWPFRADALAVRCEGRRLAARYGSEAEMRAGFEAAPWETLQLRLAPR